MIGYVTLGTNDFERAAAFYDALLGELGAKRMFNLERFVLWATSPTSASLAICKPWDGNPATAGNGVMIALYCKSRADVDRLHARALELGAKDEGAAGERGPNFYAGYFRDLDGNKLNFFTHGPADAAG
jgi:catechol 2,3-dioxygenase-like lactoylglutathione lyase family enzyme